MGGGGAGGDPKGKGTKMDGGRVETGLRQRKDLGENHKKKKIVEVKFNL